MLRDQVHTIVQHTSLGKVTPIRNLQVPSLNVRDTSHFAPLYGPGSQPVWKESEYNNQHQGKNHDILPWQLDNKGRARS
jgi:hypothetical protein